MNKRELDDMLEGAEHVGREMQRGKIFAAMDRAVDKAVKALARSDFLEFGFQAALWQNLNSTFEFRQSNAFKIFVDLALEIVEEDQGP